jgi:saccharopine dehydrogenase-like NADP-dependent oxidoreductase
MRILLVGAGGVGTAFARIAARRLFAEPVIADYDLGRAQRAAAVRDGYEAGSQAVVWQTAVNPVVALELIDSGAWSGVGVLGPEALPPRPFLELLNDYGAPWAYEERTTG